MRRGNINNRLEKNKEENSIKRQEIKPTNGDKEITLEQSTNNEVSKDKLKLILLIIFIIVSVLITTTLLIFKYVNNNVKHENNVIYDPVITNKNETKKESQDLKYLVNFKDMYTINPITIKDVEYKDGSVKIHGEIYSQKDITYVQISGLKDKELQSNINKAIKENAFYYSDKVKSKQIYNSYTTVEGNFSNILSICTYITISQNDEYVYEQNMYLNYNLATGEQIKFLDLFASNTPMNSIIYDIEYERLAWDTEIDFEMSQKEWDKATNMDKRDTSEYEDIILQAINRYKKLDKNNIKFYVTPSSIHVNLGIGEGSEEISYTIDLYKYIDYVTIYKKFLTDKVIYENVPSVKLLVFNDFMGFIPDYYKIESDNLFISVVDFQYNDEYRQELEQEEIEKYSKDVVDKKKEIMKEHKNNILNEVKEYANTHKNKGYIARFMPNIEVYDYNNEYGGEILFCASMYSEIEEMDIQYYTENAFKLLAKQNSRPRASIDDVFLGRLDLEGNNKNIKSLVYDYKTDEEIEIFELTAYYTMDGKIVANTYEEAQEYIDKKYKAPENEEVSQEDKQVNIYKEEQ